MRTEKIIYKLPKANRNNKIHCRKFLKILKFLSISEFRKGNIMIKKYLHQSNQLNLESILMAQPMEVSEQSIWMLYFKGKIRD